MIEVTSNLQQVNRELERAFRKFPDMVQDGINRTVRDISADLARSTATWNHNVDFNVSITRSGRTMRTRIGTDDEIFGYVDRGTRPHIITPRRPGYPLRFMSGYKAKTIPGKIWSQPGGAFGNIVRAMVVHHPGFPGRHILRTVMQKHEPALIKNIRLAIGAGLSKAVARVRL